MLWIDTNAFAMEEWQQDPVDFLIQNKLVLLFDNWPQGYSGGPAVKDKLKRAFGTGLCSVILQPSGRFKVKTSVNCSKRLPLVHGFFHVTDLDFYRSEPVKKFNNIWIGNGKYARRFDDQGAVSAPVYFLAPDRGADMYTSGIKLSVFHNGLVDGKQTIWDWLKNTLNIGPAKVGTRSDPKSK